MIEQWYWMCLQLLSQVWGEIQYDDGAFTWVRIVYFDLPPVYHLSETSLLMTTPGYNIENYMDYHFFVDQRLTRIDGSKPPFVHEDDHCNNLYSHGYARLSFHLESFRPTQDVVSGDNLFELAKSVYHFLGQEVE